MIFWSLIIVALGLTGVRLFLNVLDNYKIELQRHISAVIDAPVQIGTLKTRMHGLTPSLILRDIKVAGAADGEEKAIKLDEIRLNINLRDVLLKQEVWTSSWVTLVGAELSVMQRKDGSFAIAGLKADAEDPHPLWLLQGGKFELLHSRITWLNEKDKAKPLTFDRVDLVIKNDDDRHQLHMLLKLPANYGDSLRLSMALDGNFFESANINGRVYIEGHGVHLAKLASGELPLDISFGSGTGDFKFWTEWRHSQLTGVTGEVGMQQVAVGVKRREVFSTDRLSSRFNWQQRDQTWQLDVSDFVLGSAPSGPPAQFSIRGEQDSGGRWQRLALAVAQLELQEATQLLTLPGVLPAEQAELLAGLKLSGRLEAFTLATDLNTKRFEVEGRFQNLAFSSFKAVPGVTGLSGRIHGNDRQGGLQLATGAARLEAAGLFRQVLAFDRLEGTVDWRQTSDDWTLKSGHIELDAPGIKTESRMKLVWPKNDASPFLDLQTKFSMADASQAARYLPVTIMNPDTVAWLDRAFVAGRIPDGGLLMYGDLADFPFTEGQGVFEVLFNAEQVELAYHPDWPRLSELNAEVRFWSEGLTVDVHGAKTMQCSINQAAVAIPSFERSKYVKVQGKAGGSIPNILKLLQQTPLKPSIDRALKAITPKGKASVDLELDAPLVEQAEVVVDGAAMLNDAQLTLGSFELPVTQINGVLKFNELGVFAKRLDASALGYPVRVQIGNQPNQTVIDVVGHADIRDVLQRFEMPEWTFAAGDTDYRLEFMLPYNERRSPELTLYSELEGVSLDLPAALAKTKWQQRPLSLKFGLGGERILPVRLNYGNLLKASFTFDEVRRAIASGHFLYGDGQALDTGRGVKLEANRERMQLEAWLGFSEGLGEGLSMPVDQVEIHTRHLINENQDMGSLDWVVKRSPEGWKGTVRSTAAEGELHIPVDLNGNERIRLDMQFIDFSVLNRLRLEKGRQPDGLLPLFDIRSEKTFWRSVDLGRLELETDRIPGGLAFKRVELTGLQRKLSLTGSWTVNYGQSSTRLKGSFSSEQFGRLITKLGLYDDMKETRAYTDFVLSWDGAPYQFELAGLNGHVDVKLKNGRLLSIEPGVGRVLGILAFAQWGKRLQLDFRDVYKEGLSFNSIRGRIHLDHGIARTDNLVVNAVPAKISLVGDANLIDRTLDQWVTVVPKSSDAVPIAGTIVGRIAGLVASAVADDYKEGYFFGSEYQVKGSWQEPEIIPLHENDGLFQKTWQGITDFPWIEEK